MEFTGNSLDSILMKLYPALLRSTNCNEATRGRNLEILGVSLQLSNPRARISRSENRGKFFSALGELLWYLSADDSLNFIEPYIELYQQEAENGKIHGAYGPRLFRMRSNINQFELVYKLLQEKPGTRRAVIQLFAAEDIAQYHKDVPCTTTLQFHLRENCLHLTATLRSNDAYWGLPHDVFCFTMLQEIMACSLGVNLGMYYQYIGSMHIYDDKINSARNYVHEGHQKKIEMPPMPLGNPYPAIHRILELEQDIRSDKGINLTDVDLDAYWTDLVRLLREFWTLRRNQESEHLLDDFHHKFFRSLLRERKITGYYKMPRSKSSDQK